MNLNSVGILQIAGYMIQVGVYEAFGDAEYPQAFYKVLFPPGGNNDLIQHIFIADVFQTFQRVMYGEVGVLGIHAEVVFCGAASQDLVFQFRIVVVVFEGGQKHFLCGVRINGIDAVAEAFLLVQQTRCQYPDAGIGVRSLPVSLRGEKYGDQGRLGPV